MHPNPEHQRKGSYITVGYWREDSQRDGSSVDVDVEFRMYAELLPAPLQTLLVCAARECEEWSTPLQCAKADECAATGIAYAKVEKPWMNSRALMRTSRLAPRPSTPRMRLPPCRAFEANTTPRSSTREKVNAKVVANQTLVEKGWGFQIHTPSALSLGLVGITARLPQNAPLMAPYRATVLSWPLVDPVSANGAIARLGQWRSNDGTTAHLATDAGRH